MSVHKIISLLPQLNQQADILVLGSAIIDIVAKVDALPANFSDLPIVQDSIGLGGAAYNVALALKRLAFNPVCAFPIGQGHWASLIKSHLSQEQLQGLIATDKADNGWCLALVGADGERRFLTVSGVENQWEENWLQNLSVKPDQWIYVSGYQLADDAHSICLNWLEAQDKVNVFIDFGPRLSAISLNSLDAIMHIKPMVSLNREESVIASKYLSIAANPEALLQAWWQRYQAPLIIRLDKDGAWCVDKGQIYYCPAFLTTVVDTIGAGDAHAAGTLACLSSDLNLCDAMALGNFIASWVVSKARGDSAPTLLELQEKLNTFAY